jgi:predicted nuclease of predicted toxin-antitoxin system
VKFIVDAQLPEKIVSIFLNNGYDCIHTNSLPNKERTSDKEIRELAIAENRIVISKDTDFLDSYYIQASPKQLLLITTGNINNKQLLALFTFNLPKLCSLFEAHSLIEMNNESIIVLE